MKVSEERGQGHLFGEAFWWALILGLLLTVGYEVVKHQYYIAQTDLKTVTVMEGKRGLRQARLIVLGHGSYVTGDDGVIEFRVPKGVDVQLAVFDGNTPVLLENSREGKFDFVKDMGAGQTRLVVQIQALHPSVAVR